ncbi:hypothetical protein, partial [Pseudoalteromonas sp. GABNS16H]|nr:ATPase [Pseudoalteromonas sp. GABNS16H]
LLRRALRAMRNEQFDLNINTDIEIKKFLRTIITSCQHEKSSGSPWSSFPRPKNFFLKVESWQQSIAHYMGLVGDGDDRLNLVHELLESYVYNRQGQYPQYEATVSEVDQILATLNDAFLQFGGVEGDLLPKSEDAPVRFNGE